MKTRTKKALANLPGGVASVLMIVFVALWAWWSANEMYHEGWWGPWWHPLPYLAPLALTLIPTLLAFRWPIAGGIVIVAVGVFAYFFFANDVAAIGVTIAIIGLAFVADGVLVRRAAARGEAPASRWRSRWRYLLAIGVPSIVLLSVSAYTLPIVLTRVDDGDRSARQIAGKDVALTWAPAGPGWNWRQRWGGYPSWQSIALYGVPPAGVEEKRGYAPQREGGGVFASGEDMRRTNLCSYLSDDGSTLLGEAQGIWRMPTTAEVLQTLSRHGENAGCTWNGKLGFAQCEMRPDKESPLWATDVPVIYYWTADSYDDRRGYFVSHNGAVNASHKSGGNPRHGYRCVKP